MRICRIEGSVHATVQDENLVGQSILIARPVDLEGHPDGPALLALDRVGAGSGDLVLVMKEGGGARIVLENPDSPVQCLVVAVIDDISLSED
ncbi:MAG: EutN/CcmL family microcompartment protein [Planctomycetes bacterium]|nr:EutN/CcmL family microcompartment protein [Planctomycetota bacterium]